MGALSQGSGGEAPSLTVSAPADLTAVQEVDDSIAIPIAGLAIGDFLEFSIRGLIPQFDFDTTAWAWNLYFGDVGTSTNLLTPSLTGVVNDLTYEVICRFVRVTPTVPTNVQYRGSIFQFFGGRTLAEVAINMPENGEFAIPLANAALMGVNATTDVNIDAIARSGWARVTHNLS